MEGMASWRERGCGGEGVRGDRVGGDGEKQTGVYKWCVGKPAVLKTETLNFKVCQFHGVNTLITD